MVHDLERRIEDVHRRIEERLETWRALRQQRRTALLQSSPSTFQDTAFASSTQQSPSVPACVSAAALPHDKVAGVAAACTQQWRGSRPAVPATGQLAVARTMAAVQINGTAAQGPPASLDAEGHRFGAGKVATSTAAAMQKDRSLSDFSETPSAALMQRYTSVSFWSRMQTCPAKCQVVLQMHGSEPAQYQ